MAWLYKLLATGDVSGDVLIEMAWTIVRPIQNKFN